MMHEMNKDDLKVGDTVVVFYGNRPLIHNTDESIRELGGRGARGLVTKIGRKNVHVTTIGNDLKCAADSMFQCFRIEQAKQIFRQVLELNDFNQCENERNRKVATL